MIFTKGHIKVKHKATKLKTKPKKEARDTFTLLSLTDHNEIDKM